MNHQPRNLTLMAEVDPTHQPKRVRHEIRRRLLTVIAVEALTPHMRRLHFQSPDLHDFPSMSPDDHVKLLLQDTDGGVIMRDYTPRRFDIAAGTLVMDFAVHDAGPATAWALAAQPGDTLEIGGPKASTVVPDLFDWYLLVGDETALPAIGRRMEELRPSVVVKTVVVVEGAEDIQAIETQAQWTARWIRRDLSGRDDTANGRAAIDDVMPNHGNGFVWIAGEAEFAKSLRAHLLEAHGHPFSRMKAAGYWVRGAAGVHEPLS
jgi:NADPH-dependent ferric siderophore reductase